MVHSQDTPPGRMEDGEERREGKKKKRCQPCSTRVARLPAMACSIVGAQYDMIGEGREAGDGRRQTADGIGREQRKGWDGMGNADIDNVQVAHCGKRKWKWEWKWNVLRRFFAVDPSPSNPDPSACSRCSSGPCPLRYTVHSAESKYVHKYSRALVIGPSISILPLHVHPTPEKPEREKIDCHLHHHRHRHRHRHNQSSPAPTARPRTRPAAAHAPRLLHSSVSL